MIIVDISVHNRQDHGRGIDRVVRKYIQYNSSSIKSGEIALAEWNPEVGYVSATKSYEKYGIHRRSFLSKLITRLSPYVLPTAFHKLARRRGGLSSDLINGYRKIELKEGDTIFLPDSTWSLSAEYRSYIKNLSEKCKVVPILYDMIPVTHPEFVQKHNSQNFHAWIRLIRKVSDKVLAISQTVKSHYIKTGGQKKNDVSVTYLGSDFFEEIQQKPVKQDLVDIFMRDSTSPVFLVVGAIDPRKNHETIFEACKSLWDEGARFKLLVVGRVTPLCSKLVKEMKKHKEYGSQLFIREDLDDNNLSFCYANCKATISASVIEGLDLPSIEAREMNAKLLLSDTKEHKEVNPEALFFSAKSAKSLAKQIKHMLDHPFEKQKHDEWQGWEESIDNINKELSNV